MNCLCCGKPITDIRDKEMWHRRCVKKFFGTSSLPIIEIDINKLEYIAAENTNLGYTIPGVQKKLSLHLFSAPDSSRLTIVNYPTGYILKPQVEEFTALPEAEHLVMSMADKVGIAVVPHALIKCGADHAYITKRVDRKFEGDTIKMSAMEDFCQLDLRLTQDKYKGSYERCAKVIEKYSSRKGLDISELFIRIVFSFIVGNSDMHLKNFSLIETEEGSGEYILSPAYDLLPVNLVLPEDNEQTALALNGKKRNIRKKDFLVFAESCGISKDAAIKMISRLIAFENKFIEMCNESLLPDEMKESFIELIRNRIEILK